MALGLVLVGLFVLCRSYHPVLLLLAEEDSPSWSNIIPCGRFGDLYFPFTNTNNPRCGLYIRGCDDPGATVEVRLGIENETWLHSGRTHRKRWPCFNVDGSRQQRRLQNILSEPYTGRSVNCSLIWGWNVRVKVLFYFMICSKEWRAPQPLQWMHNFSDSDSL